MILWCAFYNLPLCSVQMLKIQTFPINLPPSCKQHKMIFSQQLRLLPAHGNLDPAVGFDRQL